MRIPFARLLLTTVVSLTSLPAAHATSELYGTDFSNSLYKINTATGAATLVGMYSSNSMAGIAFDSSGALFSVDVGSMDFYSINPLTAASTLIGSTGLNSGEGALAFDPTTGILYSKSNTTASDEMLITINPTTGAGTVVGPMLLPNIEADPSGFAFLSDGSMYALDLNSSLPSRLLSVNKSTGAATVIGATGETFLSGTGGLAVDPDTGIMYMSNTIQLFTVNPGTGAATLVGSHGIGGGISGLSFGDPGTGPIPHAVPALDGLALWALTGGLVLAGAFLLSRRV